MNDCLLFPLECRGGALNMAADDALLGIVESEGLPALRFYTWSEPTLSLGYFQTIAERGRHEPSSLCPLVRRASGGGAIVHDREVTYALALPRAHPLAANARSLYNAVHEALIEVLRQIDVTAKLAQKQMAGSDEPFLCFQRRMAGDVLIAEYKVCGSAQRRQRTALLQHGSLLLGQSRAAPELPGLEELVGRFIPPELLIQRWQAALAQHFAWRFHPSGWSEHQWKSMEKAVAAKYAHPGWTGRR